MRTDETAAKKKHPSENPPADETSQRIAAFAAILELADMLRGDDVDSYSEEPAKSGRRQKDEPG